MGNVHFFSYVAWEGAVTLKPDRAVSLCSKALQDVCCTVAGAMLALQCGQHMLLQRLFQMCLLTAKMFCIAEWSQGTGFL